MSYRANRSTGPGSRYPAYPGTGTSGVQGHEYLEEENNEKEEEMRKKGGYNNVENLQSLLLSLPCPMSMRNSNILPNPLTTLHFTTVDDGGRGSWVGLALISIWRLHHHVPVKLNVADSGKTKY